MLRIYKASGAQDLPDILFNGIAESLENMRSGKSSARRVILVVPAQFTLKAEELAFEKLGGDGFFDLHIVSNNKLAQQIIKECGGMGRTPVDTLGRSMLLRKIAKELAPELSVFSAVAEDAGFLDMAGDFIVQLKQNNVKADDIPDIAGGCGGLLARKLSDMQRICKAYDRAMEGRFNDSEDLRAYVTSKIPECGWVCGAEFWYYDFYSFTQRDADFLGGLIRYSKGLNIVLMSGDPAGRPDLFAASERTARALEAQALDCGSQCRIVSSEGFELPRPAELKHIEKQLFRIPPDKAGAAADGEVLRVVKCESPEAQAEAIAVRILELVREKGLKAQDIAVLTNDTAGQGAAIKRALRQYGIPYFMDEKRSVQHSPAVSAVCAVLDMEADGYRADAVLRFLKSGFSGIVSPDEADAFENYAVQYRVKGKKFLEPFRYGRKALGDGVFDSLEAIRSRFAALAKPFDEAFGKSETVRERSAALYNFLNDTLRMPDELERRAAALAEAGFADASEETAQIWNVIADLMDQACELLGGEKMSAQEYRDLLVSSFADIKLGLLPQAEGRVLVGTVDRSRLSGVRALFVAGINDGILPSDRDAEGILTEAEQAELEKRSIILSKSREIIRQEELLSVYRTFCEASDFLWLGYCMTNPEGEDIKPSPLIDQILSMFPGMSAEAAGDAQLAYVQAPGPASAHMTAAFREYLSGEAESISDVWKLSYNSLRDSGDPRAEAVSAGLLYKNDAGRLGAKRAAELYSADGMAAVLSPSRLESFAACPFKYFVNYGLRPSERKPFELESSDIGSVYHGCLLRFCDRLSSGARRARVPMNDPSSDWMRVTKEEVSQMIEDILAEMAETEFDGLLSAGRKEIYRTGRLRKTCAVFAWNIVEQVRKGKIDRMLFESRFGRGRKLPPVTVGTPLGNVSIEGIIDRVDVISAGDAEYIKIIDYKSGPKVFSREAAEKGLALQLNIYLESALGAGLADKPAGMFFFSIHDQSEAARLAELGPGELSEKLAEKLRTGFRLNGILVGEQPVVYAMDSDIADGRASAVLGVSRDKSGALKDSAATRMVSREEFDEFRQTVRKTVSRLCEELVSGDISIDPKRLYGGKDMTACTYCDYRSVCLFENA